MCILLRVYLSYLYGPKYVSLEPCVFNYRSTYHICIDLSILMWNYVCLIVDLIDIFLWNYLIFTCECYHMIV
jgi:hypothetical protein